MSNNSSKVIITLEHDGASIRLSDVLSNSARVYSRDFEPIRLGSLCELVIKVDDKETREQIQLLEDLTNESNEFTFIRSKAKLGRGGVASKMSEEDLKDLEDYYNTDPEVQEFLNAPMGKYEEPEPTIKVSELRNWLIEWQNSLGEPSYIYEIALFNFIDEILTKFCEGKDE